MPVSGTLTHSKAAPERLCNQTDLLVSLAPTLLPSSSGFGITGLKIRVGSANPEPDFL